MLPECSTPTPEQGTRKRGKSMSRRSGQNPQPVIHRGWWTVRYWIDVPGQEKRMRVRAKICPLSDRGSLTSSEIERKARDIIRESGADTVAHFEKCAASTLVETFRQRADTWLMEMQTKEEPIAVATLATYKSCLSKWLNPNLGDLPLSSIYADTVRDILAPKFRAAGLSAKSRHEFVAVVQLVVASVKDKHSEQYTSALGIPISWDCPKCGTNTGRSPGLNRFRLLLMVRSEGIGFSRCCWPVLAFALAKP